MVTYSDRAAPPVSESAIPRFLSFIALTPDQKEVVRMLLFGAATLALLFFIWLAFR